MFSNGNSFANGSSYSSNATFNGSSTFNGEGRNTEPFYWRFLCQIQPGAVA